MSDHDPVGRRRAVRAGGRRPSALTALALLLPLLTVGALALVRPAPVEVPDRSPSEVPLERTALVCPAALPGSPTVTVGNLDGERGEVSLRTRGEGQDRALDGGVLTPAPDGAVVVGAQGALAPGLVASRGGNGRAHACTAPAPERWFTGVGAGPEQSSTLTLTNPDRGRAVAEVTVHGPDGVLDVPDLRGVTVLGGRTARLDLARVVPTRDPLTLHVVVTRGRLGIEVEDRVDELGRTPVSRDWVPHQTDPAETSYVVGLGGTGGSRTLSVTNPGEDEARVALRLVSERSELTPAGVEELRVAPGSVATLDLGRVLRGRVGRDALALRLDATEAVTATLRTRAGADLFHSVPGVPLEGRAGVALPRGRKQLVLAGSEEPGVVTWRALDQSGEELDSQRVEVDPGRGTRVGIPAAARLLEVVVERTGLVAAVEVGPPGTAVVPLVPLAEAGLVPDVRPALR